MDAASPERRDYVPFFAGHQPPPIHFSKSHSPSRLRLTSLCTGAAIAIAFFGPLAALVVYVFILHSFSIQGDQIQTGARYKVIVSLTSIISKVGDFAIVPIMAIMATVVAAEWYRASEGFDSAGRPTAVQLGTAMSVLGGPNPRSFWAGLQMCLGIGSAQRHSQTRLPAKIKLSIFVFAWLLALHYGITGLDQALHWSSEPTSMVEQKRNSAIDQSSMQYSRLFNNTICTEWESTNHLNQRQRSSCGLDNGSNNVAYIATPEYLRTLTNSSDTNRIAWADDNSAIMVPAHTANVSYVARALGVKSKCSAITSQCVTCAPQNGYTYCRGGPSTSEAHFDFNCPSLNTTKSGYSSGYFGGSNARTTTTNSYVDALIDPDTDSSIETPYGDGDYLDGAAKGNPFRYAFVAQTYAYAGLPNATTGNLIGDTGFLQWGHQGALSVIDCQLLVIDAVYEFTPPSTYKMRRYQPADLRQAKYISMFYPSGGDVTNAAQGNGASTNTMSFADAAALEVSKQTVAGAAVMFDTQPVLQVLGTPVQGSTVFIPALAAFVALTALFGLTAFAVGIGAAISMSGIHKPTISLVRQRLLSPQGILLDLYGRASSDDADLFSDKLCKAFAPTTESDRLVIGTFFERGQWRVRAHAQQL